MSDLSARAKYPPSMSTPLSRGWEIVFRLTCLESRGDAFQELFARIMERRDPDFQRVRPWGNQGDRKNDGWSPARRTLFQCYAPSAFKASRLETKLIEDYEGAISHWEDYFNTWIFVHNDSEGLAPNIAKRIAELNTRSPNVTCSVWGIHQLREEFALLNDADREALLGPALTQQDFQAVDASSLRGLIEKLGSAKPDPSAEILPVPPNKIKANALKPAQVDFLMMGSQRAPLVESYLSNAFVLPSEADSIAEAVADRYRRFRDDGRSASTTFDLMLAWICGGGASSTTRASALAILAYFFERCHIFESPNEVPT